MSNAELMSRPGMASLVQGGTVVRRARKGEQKNLEFPAEIVMDIVNPRYDTRAVVRAAICAGWTAKAVAAGTGIKISTVRTWSSTGTEADPLFDYPSPAIEVPKLTRRISLVPSERIEVLKRLNEVVRTINGGTAVDDPRREVIPIYGDMLVRTLTEYNIGAQTLSHGMGLSGRAVQLWLGRHGYLNLAPSQKAYTGTPTAIVNRRNRLNIGSTAPESSITPEQESK